MKQAKCVTSFYVLSLRREKFKTPEMMGVSTSYIASIKKYNKKFLLVFHTLFQKLFVIIKTNTIHHRTILVLFVIFLQKQLFHHFL